MNYETLPVNILDFVNEMASMSMPEFYASYKKWIRENPKIKDVFSHSGETTLKWISYFVEEKIRNSNYNAGELLCLLEKLMELFNDQPTRTDDQFDKLQIGLAILQICKVLAPLGMGYLLGPTGKLLMAISIPVYRYVSEQVSINTPILHKNKL